MRRARLASLQVLGGRAAALQHNYISVQNGWAAFHPSVTQHVKNESSALGKAKPGKVSRVSVATFLDLGFGFKVADLLGMGEEASLYDSAWRRSRAIRPIPLWDEDFSTGFRLRLEPLGRF